MEKTIKIGEKEIKLKATAAIPRMYRIHFRRDIMQDLNKLAQSVQSQDELQIPDLETFENVAYIMAKHADSSIPNTADEWLEQFETFEIYEILPSILELWNLNMETTAESKKNKRKVVGS